MLLEIIGLFFAVATLTTACACVAGARTTAPAPTAPAPAPVPAPKDQRPLWAQAPMVDAVQPRCSAWENEQARIDARLLREAEAAKAAREEMEAERRLRARLKREAEERRAWAQEWEPAKLPPPEPRYHRPLKAKGRNWA